MIFHSSFELIDLWLPLVGFLVGLIGTLIGGGGGGFFFIPILTILFGVPAQVAVATSLAATLPICIIGSIGHYRNDNIDLRLGLIMAAAGVLGALGGASFTSLITHKQLIICYGSYAILIALLMIRSNLKKKRDEANGIEKCEDPKFIKSSQRHFFRLSGRGHNRHFRNNRRNTGTGRITGNAKTGQGGDRYIPDGCHGQ